MNAAAPEATEDYSKGPRGPRVPFGAVAAALGAAAVAGALLLVVAEFSTLIEVVVGSLASVQRRVDAGDSHHHVLLVVAVLALPLAYGAARGARPAALALVVLGLVALGVGLLADLPDTRASAHLPEGVAFEDARTRAGPALALELWGGALLTLSGGALAVVAARLGRA